MVPHYTLHFPRFSTFETEPGRRSYQHFLKEPAGNRFISLINHGISSPERWLMIYWIFFSRGIYSSLN
jgi:hypothetical protein